MSDRNTEILEQRALNVRRQEAEELNALIKTVLSTMRGPRGETGPIGKSAYEVAAALGFSGTEREWLDALIGKQGERGAPGRNGEPGRSGDKGDTGDPGINWRGPWRSDTTYDPLDAVEHQGSSWIAIKRTEEEPSVVSAAWDLLAKKGNDGVGSRGQAGLDGATGPAGADGAPGDAADIAAEVHSAAEKSTPVDADELGLIDSAASWVLKKLTWANLKAALGLGTLSTQNANNVAITGGSVTGITDLAVADGGTLAIGLAGVVSGNKVQVGDGNAYASALGTDKLVMSYQDAAPGFTFVVASSANVAHRGLLKGIRARGTLNTPSAPTTDDYVMSLLGSIYDGSAGQATAEIALLVDGAVSAGVAPQRISFLTGPAGRTEKWRISYAGNFSNTGASGTAYLHLKAGTATANTGPLKFEPGVLLTTPERGTVEFTDDGTTGRMYVTMNVAGVMTRREIQFV